MQSIEKQIVSRIYGKKRGWCFTPKDFLDIAKRPTASSALSRLVKKGTIRHLERGLYDYPKEHSKIGLLAPDPTAIAKAIASKNVIRLQPSGAYAANLLGLTEQVPAKIIFLTDGSEKSVKIGLQEIVLKNTTPRKMVGAGKMSGMLMHALSHIGKANIDSQHISLLKNKLSQKEKGQLKNSIKHLPVWMHPYIQEITEGIDA